MRFLILLLTVVMSSSLVKAEELPGAKHHKQVSTGMYSLLGWSLSNITVGTVLNFSTTGKLRYFHQFNAGWNLVNLGLASGGLISLRRKDFSSMENLMLFEEVNSMSKVFLFNAGLDIGYVAFGAYLNERGEARQDERLMGYGKALMLQGSFLFAFDLLMYKLLNTNSRAMFNSMSALAPSSSGLGFVIRF